MSELIMVSILKIMDLFSKSFIETVAGLHISDERVLYLSASNEARRIMGRLQNTG